MGGLGFDRPVLFDKLFFFNAYYSNNLRVLRRATQKSPDSAHGSVFNQIYRVLPTPHLTVDSFV